MKSHLPSPSPAPAQLAPKCIISKLAADADMELAMPAALTDGEFIPYYQPLMSNTGEIRGCEALMRWMRADGSFISPGEFIPLAERNGFITDLGAYVLQAAVRQLRLFDEAGLEHLYMSVNVSPRQLEHPGFEAMLAQALVDAGVAPQRLVLELTEGVAVTDRAHTRALLDRIAATGVRIALDDYGTGYASLGYLRAYPVSTVKIDRSFIEGLAQDEVSAILVKAVVDLSKALQLEVVAEGVETALQAQVLREMGVTYLQGYLYGPAMPAGELVARFGPSPALLN